MSTLTENVEKVKSAHAAISASIEAKGVSVPAGTKLTGMPALVDQIQTGGLEPNTSKVSLHVNRSKHIDVNRIIVADTSQMTSFEGFFQDDTQLTSFSLPPNFAPNATNMNGFFMSCNSIKNINIPPNFAPNAKSFERFLENCYNLTAFEYAEDFGLNAENIYKFYNSCTSMLSIDVPPNFANVKNCDHLFFLCRNLKSITFPENFGHQVTATSEVRMFEWCNSLVDIYGDIALSVSFSVPLPTVSHDSIVRVLNSIPTLTTTQTLFLGKENMAKLTDEEKKIATDKGWTLGS